MVYDDKGIKVGDTVVFESMHVRCEGKVTEVENNLGACWIHVTNPAGWQCATLKGVKRHCIPVSRVIEHHPGIIVVQQRVRRVRYVPPQ